MMNDDGGIVGGWRRSPSGGGEQEKGEMQLLAETCRPPRDAAKRLFFLSPPPDRRNLYRAAYSVQCGASRARIDCPNRDSPVYSCILSKRDSMFSQLTCRYTGTYSVRSEHNSRVGSC